MKSLLSVAHLRDKMEPVLSGTMYVSLINPF